MQKTEYFIKSIKVKAFINRDWMISAFSIVKEKDDAWKKDPYPYRIIQTPTGAFFINPEEDYNLTPLEGYSKGSPIFTAKDRVILKSGDLINLTEDIESTVGNVLFNCICITESFGNKIPFLNKKIKLSELEDLIAKKLEDSVEKEEHKLPNKLYVDEYIKFVNSIFWLTNFSQLFVWGATEKVLTPPPGIKEFKEKLLEQYKDRLTDPSVIAEIDKQLVEFDAQYLKGDPGQNFLISDKSLKIVRKRKFLMYGGESGLDDKTTIDPITNSLDEGWQIEKFPSMNNALRAGSFNRGAQTELGGESVKWLLRASSNIVVTIDDCGTKAGKPFKVTKENHKKIVDFTILVNNEKVFIETEEDSLKYVGQEVIVRSPMYCKLDKTDYCKTCVGKKLALNPTGLSMTISEYGSAFLGLFMKAMHGKSLDTVELDIVSSIN